MTTPPRRPLATADLERLLEDWMHETTERVPDRVLDAAFADTQARRQARRRWRLPGGGSGDGGGRSRLPMLVAAVLAVGALGAVGAAGLGLIQPTPDTVVPSPGDASTASPVTADPADLAATWVGVPARTPGAPDGPGTWVLRLGSFATLQGPAGEIQVIAGFTADATTMSIPSGTGDCLNVPATYAWAVTGETLTLTAVDDPCADRRSPLEAFAWQHVPDGWSIAGRFRAPFAAPAGALALGEESTTLAVFGGSGLDGGSGLAIWVIEDVRAEPCGEASGPSVTIPVGPGADGVLEALRQVDGVEVTDAGASTAAGLPARHLSVAVTGALCELPGTARLWEDHGTGGNGQYQESFRGGELDLYLVEVDGSTVAIVNWTREVDDFGPASTPERMAIVTAMRFLAPSP